MNEAEAKRVQPTLGPWEISDKSPMLVVGYDPRLFPENERVTIARVDPGGDRLDAQIGEANARLIAAAPELLQALQDTANSLERYMKDFSHSRPAGCDCSVHRDIRRAFLAISKATNPVGEKS